MSERTLNDIMQFDHVIKVRNGEITDASGVHAPEVLFGSEDGQILTMHERHVREELERSGWTLETGWSGQYSYSGPIMHQSEYIGGALADHIRETDGFWVAVSAEMWPYEDDNDSPDPAGWLLLHRDLNTVEYVLTTGGWPDSGAIAHRIKGSAGPTYSGPNKTGCGITGTFSIHSRDAGWMTVTCKRKGCMQ